MNWENFHKKLGYGLLIAGLLLIILPLFQTYSIFIGKGSAPQIFTSDSIAKPRENVSNFDVQGQMQNAFINILPLGLISSTLNLSSWFLLTFILVFIGKQLADIGVKLIK